MAPSLHAMMAKSAISPDQYTVVDLPADVKMFASGDVPVWGVYLNAFLIQVQKAGYEVSLISPDDYGVHFYADTIHTTDALIETDPDPCCVLCGPA